MVDPSSLAGMFGSTMQQLVSQIYYLVGGIFGIYVILVGLRWWEYRMVRKLLIDIKLEIRHLNEKMCGSIPKKETNYVIKKLTNFKEKLNGKKKKPKRKYKKRKKK